MREVVVCLASPALGAGSRAKTDFRLTGGLV